MIHRTKFASDPYLPSLIHNLECCPTVINFGQNQLTIQKFTTIHQFQNHIFPSHENQAEIYQAQYIQGMDGTQLI